MLVIHSVSQVITLETLLDYYSVLFVCLYSVLLIEISSIRKVKHSKNVFFSKFVLCSGYKNKNLKNCERYRSNVIKPHSEERENVYA